MIRRLATVCFLELAMGACAHGEGDGVTTLDTRDIFFLVPPEIPDVPID